MQTPSEESPQLCVCPVRQTPAENLVKAPQRASQIKEFQESYGSAAREWHVPASEGSVANLANRTGFQMSSEHSAFSPLKTLWFLFDLNSPYGSR